MDKKTEEKKSIAVVVIKVVIAIIGVILGTTNIEKNEITASISLSVAITFALNIAFDITYIKIVNRQSLKIKKLEISIQEYNHHNNLVHEEERKIFNMIKEYMDNTFPLVDPYNNDWTKDNNDMTFDLYHKLNSSSQFFNDSEVQENYEMFRNSLSDWLIPFFINDTIHPVNKDWRPLLFEVEDPYSKATENLTESDREQWMQELKQNMDMQRINRENVLESYKCFNTMFNKLTSLTYSK
ncbi:MAG: hypothetical protein KKH92_02810 [Firmicutes bacterium]|nr:hypothetical protein [Bacillota bacterium]